jgi:hypothetical protein
MALPAITGGGSFTRQNIQQINANFAAVSNPDVWVRPQYGNNNSADGTYARPYATMAGLSAILKPGMVVGVEGVLFEEYSSPRVNDVTIVGMANLPRQATTSGAANGGGATWLSPSGGTGALLQPNGQGWRVENLFFNNSATAAGCIKLVNAGDPPTSNCSEKFSLIGCILTGTDDGVAALDLPNNVLIDGCTFFGFSGSGDLGISSATGAGTGTLNNWTIQNCTFQGNAGHITAPFTSSTIRNNHFSYIYGSVTSTTQVILTSGSNNSVYGNHFDLPYTTTGLAAMFALGTNDRWSFNEFATAVATTIYSFGAPTT